MYLPRELGGLTRERGGGGKGKLVVSGCELEELMPLLLGLPRSVSESEDESPYEANKASIFFLEKYKASIFFLFSCARHTSDLSLKREENRQFIYLIIFTFTSSQLMGRQWDYQELYFFFLNSFSVKIYFNSQNTFLLVSISF